MNDQKVKGRLQEASERVHNFNEVEFGFNDEEALQEANRCLHCPKPRCMEGCPVSIQIPEFIQAIKDQDLKKAYEIISMSSSLPAVCGRVCPQEKQCESMCVKGLKGEAISIGSLERYVADQAIINGFNSVQPKPKNGKRVGRLIEESAKAIESTGAKFGGARNNKGGLKQSHGRDSGTPTAVALGSRLTAVTPDSGQSRP